MKEETDWKLIFVLEFDTLLFELKLLRPAFVLLFALLSTISVYFINLSTSAREVPSTTKDNFYMRFSLDVFRSYISRSNKK